MHAARAVTTAAKFLVASSSDIVAAVDVVRREHAGEVMHALLALRSILCGRTSRVIGSFAAESHWSARASRDAVRGKSWLLIGLRERVGRLFRF